MAIIVEGFDNSGKSTLASSFGLPIFHPGPRPKSSLEEYQCLTTQMDRARDPVVLDRVTSISTPCYTGQNWSVSHDWAKRMIGQQSCVVIYCRPPIEKIVDFSRHVAKDYDEAKHVQWLIDNAEGIVANYDLYMAQLPHLKYDYTNPDRRVVQLAYDAQISAKGWDKWLAETRK